MPGTIKKCIIETDEQGWLLVLFDLPKPKQSLPRYMQVEYLGTKINVPLRFRQGDAKIKTTSGQEIQVSRLPSERMFDSSNDSVGQERDFFTVLEGPSEYRGKAASVKVLRGGRSCLGPFPTYAGAASLVFEYEKNHQGLIGTVSWPGGKVAAITDPSNPTPPGLYAIELPDFPHDIGVQYLHRSKNATIWFRIGHSGDRYLHPGMITEGCCTVTEIEKWNRLYQYLILSRKGDGQSVGTIKIVYKVPKPKGHGH